MIPKIIHYCWFENTFPNEIKNNIQSWRKYLPDWKFIQWDLNSIKSCSSSLVHKYKNIGNYEILAEFIKIWSIYTYGGIYIDPRNSISKNLDYLLCNKFFLGQSTGGNLLWDFLGCEKRNYIAEELLGETQEIGNIDLSKILEEKYPKVKELQGETTIFNRFIVYSDLPKGKSFYSKNPLVSVVMPVLNGEKYISQSIESVLNQTYTNLELIIVDDGSTDNTENLVISYTDSRIKYIKLEEHLGISEALNQGILSSHGEFIARIDCDDLMYSDRIEKQLSYFKNNPEVDILGTGFEWGNGKPHKEFYKPQTGKVSRDTLLNVGNIIGHPTVMMKRSSLLNTFGDTIYESYYNGAEDYKLWIKSIDNGLTIHNLTTPTTYYRQHSEQSVINSDTSKITKRIINSYTRKNNSTTELTVIIPFKNEGIEVEKTVASVRATSRCNIILINDFSTDSFNYKDISDRFGCTYFETDQPFGVAKSRDFGVNNIETPYFVLLDSHMRFYDDDWDLRIVKHLKENPKSIITSNSSIFTKEPGKPYKNEDGKSTDKLSCSNAAVVNMKEPGWEFSGRWTKTTDILNLPDQLSQCSCVMGAFYASSKTWWSWIGGLQGLEGWGFDEPLMCIKTYLAGGCCYILRDFFVGHLYRGTAPYQTYTAGIDSNQIYLINLFSPKNKIEEYENNLKSRIGNNKFKQAKQAFLNRYDDFERFKNYFYTRVAKLGWEEFLKINDKFY